MSMWNPWRGCKKCSDGCKYCYIHKGDFKRNVNTNDIIKTKDFNKPIEKLKNGTYKVKSGVVYLCFSSDFLIEEADKWRAECWEIIKERSDLHFLFLTKRIDRFLECIPKDWGNGYDNVTVCCTIENQKNADYKLSIFKDLPIKHKCITAQPLIGKIDLEKYLDNIELVVVGGESDYNARPLDYSWVLDIRNQCIKKNVDFEFRQCGTFFMKDGKQYKLQTRDLSKQARLANINYVSSKVPIKNINVDEKQILLSSIDKIHTTDMGVDRIKKNLKLDTLDVVSYCKSKVINPDCIIYKQGKNWYAEIDNCKITINSYNYTIITAHLIK